MKVQNPTEFPSAFTTALVQAVNSDKGQIAIMLSDSDGWLHYCNHTSELIFRFEASDVIGKQSFSSYYDHLLDDQERQKIRERLKSGKCYTGYLKFIDAEGTQIILWTTLAPVKLPGTDKRGILSLSVDHSASLNQESLILDKSYVESMEERILELDMLRHTYEQQAESLASAFDEMLYTKLELEEKSKALKKANQELIEAKEEQRILSITDPLTSLYNRRHFNSELEKVFDLSKRYQRSFSIFILDIDHFKKVNDNFGHPFGDQVIIGVADALRESLRNVDTCARWGGEEFMVLLPETGEEGAFTMAERIRTKISEISFLPGDVHVTISLGITTFDGSNQDQEILDDLLKQSDQALYQAKNSGRNKTCIYQKVSPSVE